MVYSALYFNLRGGLEILGGAKPTKPFVATGLHWYELSTDDIATERCTNLALSEWCIVAVKVAFKQFWICVFATMEVTYSYH